MRSKSSFKSQLQEAWVERDEALQKLALVRAELDALKASLLRAGEPVPPAYPLTANPASPPPLRYQVADGLHSATRRWLGPLRTLLKSRR